MNNYENKKINILFCNFIAKLVSIIRVVFVLLLFVAINFYSETNLFFLKVQAVPSFGVRINQNTAQLDPTYSNSVNFTVIFAEAINVSSFTAADIVLTGTANGKTVNSITQITPNDGTTFVVNVTTTSTGTVIANIPASVFSVVSTILGTTGRQPRGVVRDSAGNTYTVNTNSNNVTRITPAGVSTIFGTTGTNPIGITIDSADNIYTANSGSNNVTRITPAGVSTIFGTTGSSPNGIAIDSAGNIYVANFNSNNVTRITPAGVSTIFATMAAGSNPIDIVFNAGNIYVTNFNTNNVTRITLAGASSIFGTTGTNPRGLVLDSAGNLYTANTNSNNVTRITPAGVSTIFGTTGANPIGIAIDSAGNIYTTNTNSDNVTRITPAGVSTIFGTTGSNPRGITIDSAGNLYVTNYGNGNNNNTVTRLTNTLTSGVANLTIDGNGASTSTDNSITIIANATVSGVAFVDRNANGIRDEIDTLAAVQIQAKKFSDNSIVATQITAANGVYSFSLPADNYYFEVVSIPVNFTITTQNASGSNNSNNSEYSPTTSRTIGVGLTSGLTLNNFDLGLIPSIDLSVRKTSSGGSNSSPITSGTVSLNTFVDYTLVVTNNNTSYPSSGVVTVTDTLPMSTVEYLFSSGVGWNCSFVSPTVTCVSNISIPANSNSNPITITVKTI